MEWCEPLHDEWGCPACPGATEGGSGDLLYSNTRVEHPAL